MNSDFHFAQTDCHTELQPNFYWAQCENDRKLHQRCHFDEFARRNLFEQTDLSYRRGDSKKNLSLVAKSKGVLSPVKFLSLLNGTLSLYEYKIFISSIFKYSVWRMFVAFAG